jgi:hypothetical protein
MNTIAERFATYDVQSIFLYTHEAHPGENYPHLTSMAQKFKHATDLREILGVSRRIVLDSLDGACHRAYGSMPNMTWIISAAGIPIYKSNWTDANSIANALEYFVQAIERRRAGEQLTPFQVERLDFRNVDRETFFKGLERNGPKAVREYREAFNLKG